MSREIGFYGSDVILPDMQCGTDMKYVGHVTL